MFQYEDRSGADVYCELFSSYTPVEAHSTHYEGEIDAVYIILKQLSIHIVSKFRNVPENFRAANESFFYN